MKRIAIIGGGISGLSAAFVLEQQRRAGSHSNMCVRIQPAFWWSQLPPNMWMAAWLKLALIRFSRRNLGRPNFAISLDWAASSSALMTPPAKLIF